MIDPLHYDHLPFIAGAYALFAAVTLYFALGARARLQVATRRLRAADLRGRATK